MQQHVAVLLLLGLLGTAAGARVSLTSSTDESSTAEQVTELPTREAVSIAMRQLTKTKAPPAAKPTVDCPRVRGYTEFPDTDTEGDTPGDVIKRAYGKNAREMGIKCYNDCDCAVFTLEKPEFRKGYLKINTRFTPGNKPGSCLYVRHAPCPHKDYAVAPGQYVSSPPGSWEAPGACKACVDVGLDLFWVLLSGEKGTNPPLTQANCDALAASLPATSLGNASGLLPWRCTELVPDDSYGGSTMQVCAGGSDTAVHAWFNKTKKEDYRYNSNFIARAIDQSICWVHGLASLSCEKGYWPFKKILCD